MPALRARLVGWLGRVLGAGLVPAVLACVALLAAPGAAAQDLQPVPPLKARVTDLTGTLDAAQVQALEASLADIEQRKGAQVAILMVPTTRPEAIEQFSIRVAEAWKLGRGRELARKATGDPNAPAVDDGVLVLIAKEDRRIRIEVGYGLEGAIPDGIAKRIIDESIAPHFRRNDYFGGLQAAVQDLRLRIDGEELPPPWQRGADARADDGVMGLVPVLVFAFVAGTIASAVMGRLLGAGAGGLAAGFFGGAAVGSVAAAIGIGLLVFVLVLLMAPSPGGGLRRAGRHTYRHGPIIFPGGGWGGGGGGGFGGFGGGGGGFGGGGASGGW